MHRFSRCHHPCRLPTPNQVGGQDKTATVVPSAPSKDFFFDWDHPVASKHPFVKQMSGCVISLIGFNEEHSLANVVSVEQTLRHLGHVRPGRLDLYVWP